MSPWLHRELPSGPRWRAAGSSWPGRLHAASASSRPEDSGGHFTLAKLSVALDFRAGQGPQVSVKCGCCTQGTPWGRGGGGSLLGLEFPSAPPGARCTPGTGPPRAGGSSAPRRAHNDEAASHTLHREECGQVLNVTVTTRRCREGPVAAGWEVGGAWPSRNRGSCSSRASWAWCQEGRCSPSSPQGHKVLALDSQ